MFCFPSMLDKTCDDLLLPAQDSYPFQEVPERRIEPRDGKKKKCRLSGVHIQTRAEAGTDTAKV
jgi:hypothetical protein